MYGIGVNQEKARDGRDVNRYNARKRPVRHRVTTTRGNVPSVTRLPVVTGLPVRHRVTTGLPGTRLPGVDELRTVFKKILVPAPPGCYARSNRSWSSVPKNRYRGQVVAFRNRML
jgi:hypothetical protein